MSRIMAILMFSGLLVLAIHGCDNIALPAGSIGEPEVIEQQQSFVLEADQVYPREQKIGHEITVFGRNHTFPTGFYRVTFTGGTTYEFFQASATSNLTIEIPVGARSGPFGFIVGAEPNSGHEMSQVTTDGFYTYSIKDPGIRITDNDPWIPR